ncbi:hypothetical protein C5688_11085 [Methylocystis sp. MitZ-2018]|nr:hypothetical protein C5688_11085 [Methylocystis sp. MitZ-2018]
MLGNKRAKLSFPTRAWAHAAMSFPTRAFGDSRGVIPDARVTPWESSLRAGGEAIQNPPALLDCFVAALLAMTPQHKSKVAPLGR